MKALLQVLVDSQVVPHFAVFLKAEYFSCCIYHNSISAEYMCCEGAVATGENGSTVSALKHPYHAESPNPMANMTRTSFSVGFAAIVNVMHPKDSCIRAVANLAFLQCPCCELGREMAWETFELLQ